MFELIAQIPVLVNRGIQFLKERGRTREKFVEQVVEPLHEVFMRLVSEHMETFSKIDAALGSADPNIPALRELLDRNILFESNTVNLLRELTESRSFTKVPQSGIRDAFDAYVSELASSLIIALGERAEPSVIYYESLGELLRRFVLEQRQSSALRDEIRKVVARFTAYQARVSRAYLEVKRRCLE